MEYSCQQCQYSWNPRKLDPRRCPRCRSGRWNTTKTTPLTTVDEALTSTALGALLTTMSVISTYPGRYAEYLQRTKQAITVNLKKLEKKGLVTSKPRKNKRVYELDDEKLSEMAKAYAKDNYNKRCQEQQKLLRDMLDFHRISPKEFETNIAIVEEMRGKMIRGIESKQAVRMQEIETAFADLKFRNFLLIYLYLFYPNIFVPFTEVIDFYLEWGDAV